MIFIGSRNSSLEVNQVHISSVENQKNNPDRLLVFVDGDYKFSIEQEDWYRLNLYVGKEISVEEIDKINQVCNFTRAKKKAIQHILFKKRTEYEIKIKLINLGFDEDVVQKVICHLKELNYIDDEDYVKKYIKDAQNIRKLGPDRIYMELIKKGVDERIIREALANQDYDEEITLRPLIQKKLAAVKDRDERALKRIRNHFIRKGYSLDMIDELLDEELNRDED
ncbi:MAG: hypothetical protein GX066_09785 [Clostridiaceae bacterium]|nr:hypothetical protein [Clostridiaceae bacterium]